MPLHLKTKAGPKKVSLATIRRLVSEGKIAPHLRVASVDGGETWMSVTVVLERLGSTTDDAAEDRGSHREVQAAPLVPARRPFRPIDPSDLTTLQQRCAMAEEKAHTGSIKRLLGIEASRIVAAYRDSLSGIPMPDAASAIIHFSPAKLTDKIMRALFPDIHYCHGQWYEMQNTPQSGFPSSGLRREAFNAPLGHETGITSDACFWLPCECRCLLTVKRTIGITPVTFRCPSCGAEWTASKLEKYGVFSDPKYIYKHYIPKSGAVLANIHEWLTKAWVEYIPPAAQHPGDLGRIKGGDPCNLARSDDLCRYWRVLFPGHSMSDLAHLTGQITLSLAGQVRYVLAHVTWNVVLDTVVLLSIEGDMTKSGTPVARFLDGQVWLHALPVNWLG